MALLQNHIAVVTGAASGIGRAIASGYAREGARVVLLDVNDKAASEVAKEIRDGSDKPRSLVPVRRVGRPGPFDGKLPVVELLIHGHTKRNNSTAERDDVSSKSSSRSIFI